MRGTQLPIDFELTDGMRLWAAEHVPQVKVEVEFQKFCDYWWSTGKSMCDWQATLRNWLRRCPQFRGAALYTQDEMRLKAISASFIKEGFRAPRPAENSVMYEFEYKHWKSLKEKPHQIRDMSVITQLVRAKTA